jgi:cytochrome c oxidase subunit III
VVPEPRSLYAVRFFQLAVFLLVAAAVIALTLLKLIPPVSTEPANRFSSAFAISTSLLLIGSGCMSRAIRSVRYERQYPFRRWLVFALISGTLFVSSQTYALTSLIRRSSLDDATSDAAAFVAVIAALHAMHFIIALLFLSYATVQAFADRYDHEYYWGITFCAWFWHALGIVWGAILVVMLIARFYA